MKSRKILALALAAATVLPLALAGCNTPTDGGKGKTSTYEVASADGSLKITAEYSNGELFYSVDKDGKHVVLKSNTGLDSDIGEQFDALPAPAVKIDGADISYSVKTGKRAQVQTHYNELTLTFAEDVFRYEVIFRAYDDGYAFRYKLYTTDNSAEHVVVRDENTTFTLPETSTLYMMRTPSYTERFPYEESYTQRKAEKINGIISSMPMLYRTSDNIWSLVTESGLVDSEYRGSFLEGDAENTFHVKPAYTQTPMLVASAPFASPWRVGIVGGPDTIVESTLVEDVYDETEYYKPDNYDALSDEEKAIYDYDWVTPTKCGWTWLKLGSGTQQQWSDNKKYIKNAADRGYGWFLIDAGWIPGSAAALEAFTDMMAYAKSLGVKMMCWAHSYNDLGTAEKRETNIARWKEYGFDGMKVDFFDGLYCNTDDTKFGESQYTINFYSSLYKIAADNQMILNIHGANKPTGERRVYPHVITREAVRGNEYKNDVTSTDCVTIPFIRGAVGPADYTPSLQPFNDNTTVASQMAMHILYETGVLTMGDSPDVYAKYAEASDFLDKLPVVYDDMKFMSGMPLSSCVIARRKGSDWYIGGMTVTAGETKVELGKLLDTDKQYEIEIFSDGDDYLKIKREVKTVNGGDTLTVKTIANGGFAISVKEKKA